MFQVIVDGFDLNFFYDFFNTWGNRIISVAIGCVVAYVIRDAFRRLRGL